MAEMPSNVYTDKDTIHDKLISRNIKHFSAAEDTPQGINGFIYNALGPHGISEFCDRVLEGNMTEEDKAAFDLVEAKELFQATSRPDPELAPEKWTTETIERIKRKLTPKSDRKDAQEGAEQKDQKEINLRITRADFRGLFKKWKESKSSTPSDRHIGHYKAILGNDDLVDFQCGMLELPRQFGFSPKRWEKTCTLMIEKNKDIGPRIDKLRVINLLEANYNFVLKLIWGRRLIRRASEQRLISPAQHARPGHIAQSTVLSKVISYDLIRLARLTAASMDNDAAGCYDKIVPPHGMLCCRRLGLPKSAAKMLATVLNNTVFYLRTGHGISARTYCTNSIRRILGSGQGSGASPCIWTAILDTILWSVAQKYTCLRITSPTGIITDKVGDPYVDDTALMYTDQEI